MTETFCTSGAVKLKAGANRPTDDTVLTGDNYTTLINQAEAVINNMVQQQGVDLVTSYASLGTNVKKILEDAASSWAAMSVIAYNMDDYTSMTEAQTMLDVCTFKWNECMALLKNKTSTDYLRGV